tara:strand:- start:501 stop:692 length:192 start_codon:yes stop_codon:yes gene_type:complete
MNKKADRVYADLSAQTQATDQVTVPLYICAFQVIQETATTTHHFEQPLARMVVVNMSLEVFSK